MAESATPAPDLVDGRFELQTKLEDQGLGEVWKARDTNLKNRVVALKFLRELPPGARELPPELAAHFKRLKALRHAYVLATTHYGLWQGRPYMVQDFFQGPSLGAGLVAGGDPLPPALLERFFDRVAASVDAAHGAKVPVAHGALHPGCVLIQRINAQTFDVRITDFGIAPYVNHPGSVVVAPEAMTAAGITASSDVFGLGRLMRLMFGASPNAAHRREDVAAEVWGAMRTATQSRPEDRFATVGALREAFRLAWAAPVSPLTDAEKSAAAERPVEAPKTPVLQPVAAPVIDVPSGPAFCAPPVVAPLPEASNATVAIENPHLAQPASDAEDWAETEKAIKPRKKAPVAQSEPESATISVPVPRKEAATAGVPLAVSGTDVEPEVVAETMYIANVAVGKSPWDAPGQVYEQTVAMSADSVRKQVVAPAPAVAVPAAAPAAGENPWSTEVRNRVALPDGVPTAPVAQAAEGSRRTMIFVGTMLGVTVVCLLLVAVAWMVLGHGGR